MKTFTRLNIVLMFVFVFSFADCKKKAGIDSIEWKDESLKLTAEICEKYRKCSEKNWSELPEKTRELAKSRLDEANCQKEFRQSNLYRLAGDDIPKTMDAYRNCHKEIIKSNCEDLQAGLVDINVDCKLVKKFQID
ncbi:hypothetical protein LPTSP4_27360 [Leptospira ryugenii]|uniref:Lipoprotein n=1 Tax=Leptospira ryugenii TaxID=1917863 RepID=A0A2P2E2X7_9LEPT|nr:hypothetical protein [Leptospira ryugenii]GBF51204.1 hypothetical protein LPTSP4_27360 [Leptospira ryugenii]